MTESDLKASAQAVMAAALSRSDGHPSPDELVSYHAGGLAAAERERVLKHLAVCPECAGAVLDMTSFPDVEPQDPEDRFDAADVSRNWQRFRERLGSDAATQPAEPPVKHRGLWLPRIFSSPRLAWTLAAVFLFTSLGLAFLLVSGPPTGEAGSSPRVNVTLAELVPEDEAVIRATGGQAVRVPAHARAVLLTLALVDPRSFPAYDVEIKAGEELLWSSVEIRRSPEGLFTLEIPRGFLPSGRYRIKVRGRDGDERVLLATYGVHLEYDGDE